MKKLIISFIIVLSCNIVSAQELTVEYNFGFGTYKMGDLKDALSEFDPFNDGSGNYVGLNNLKVTDDFPGHWTHQMKVGVEITKTHHVGLALDFMNTAWQKAVSDYSGSYSLTFRTKGIRLGTFYRISPADWTTGIVRPYLMLTTGAVFNDGEEKSELIIHDVNEGRNRTTIDGINFFIEPAVGCKIRLHKLFALNINAGYQFDVMKKFKDATVDPDWSGFRIQGGLIYYVPLR